MGERVYALRDADGISRAALAADIGISTGGLGAIERGERWPGSLTLYCLAERFDVSLDWLCGRLGVGRDSHKL